MTARLKAWAGRFWPVLRLRWVLFGTLLFVAALPGFGAIFLRVYENALVRRTEAELVAQGAALSAGAALLWPGAPTAAPPHDPGDEIAGGRSAERYEDVSTEIDLRSSPVLEERPAAKPAVAPPDADAAAAARRLAPAIAETKRATLSSILLLDRNGTLLSGRDAGRSLAGLPEIDAALAGHPTTTLRQNGYYTMRYPLEWISRATSIRLHHARPVKVGGEVVGAILLSRSPRALFRGMWEDRGKIAVGIAAIFAMLVVLTGILARAIVRPIEKLSEATRALASGQPAAPPTPTLQVVEIRSLFADFAAMGESIARRSRYLRDFAASLSHEFKTPLAGIRGGIELLQDHGETMEPRQRERFLANMTVDAERLSRLVSRLMELAQADMQAARAGASADLASIVARLADGLAASDFAITADVPPRLPPVAMESGALETVLATLIENARQAGAGRLELSVRHEDGSIAIDLRDDGPGIPPGDNERIFDPFFTSKRETGGTGLGLPIARALAGNSKGWLELVPSSAGAHFRLTLPATGAGIR